MIIALLCVAGALLSWSDRPARLPSRRREASPVAHERPVRPFVVGFGAAAAVLMIWPDAWAAGIGVGVGVGSAAWWDDRRRTTRPVRVRGQVAVVCDLWAACLDIGMPTGGALAAALEVVGSRGPTATDPTVRRLTQVAGLLRVGADAGRAWQPADGDPWLEPIGAAARRSQLAGADLAATVREQGRAVRRAEAGADERRAERAGVLMTAPLTLCFLPAFICLGLAPVVIALIATVDLGH